VYKGRRKFTGQIVALKFLKVPRDYIANSSTSLSTNEFKARAAVARLREEIEILRACRHRNVIVMLDCFDISSRDGRSLAEICVVTEFASGELFKILQDDQFLPESTVANVALHLCRALRFLHSRRVIHRDMKPQNILVCSNGIVKLCDFGFATALASDNVVLTSIKGTPLYMAPELVQEQPYTHRVDLWSLGVILYELLYGKPPFYTNNIFALINLIVQTEPDFSEPPSEEGSEPRDISPQCKNFLGGLLQKIPENRLDWSTGLFTHPWLEVARADERESAGAAESELNEEDRPIDIPSSFGIPSELLPSWIREPTEHELELVERVAQNKPASDPVVDTPGDDYVEDEEDRLAVSPRDADVAVPQFRVLGPDDLAFGSGDDTLEVSVPYWEEQAALQVSNPSFVQSQLSNPPILGRISRTLAVAGRSVTAQSSGSLPAPGRTTLVRLCQSLLSICACLFREATPLDSALECCCVPVRQYSRPLLCCASATELPLTVAALQAATDMLGYTLRLGTNLTSFHTVIREHVVDAASVLAAIDLPDDVLAVIFLHLRSLFGLVSDGVRNGTDVSGMLSTLDFIVTGTTVVHVLCDRVSEADAGSVKYSGLLGCIDALLFCPETIELESFPLSDRGENARADDIAQLGAQQRNYKALSVFYSNTTELLFVRGLTKSLFEVITREDAPFQVRRLAFRLIPLCSETDDVGTDGVLEKIVDFLCLAEVVPTADTEEELLVCAALVAAASLIRSQLGEELSGVRNRKFSNALIRTIRDGSSLLSAAAFSTAAELIFESSGLGDNFFARIASSVPLKHLRRVLTASLQADSDLTARLSRVTGVWHSGLPSFGALDGAFLTLLRILDESDSSEDDIDDEEELIDELIFETDVWGAVLSVFKFSDNRIPGILSPNGVYAAVMFLYKLLARDADADRQLVQNPEQLSQVFTAVEVLLSEDHIKRTYFWPSRLRGGLDAAAKLVAQLAGIVIFPFLVADVAKDAPPTFLGDIISYMGTRSDYSEGIVHGLVKNLFLVAKLPDLNFLHLPINLLARILCFAPGESHAVEDALVELRGQFVDAGGLGGGMLQTLLIRAAEHVEAGENIGGEASQTELVAAAIALDTLTLISQLARNNASLYHVFAEIARVDADTENQRGFFWCLAMLLQHSSTAVRARAASCVGNLVRHGPALYKILGEPVSADMPSIARQVVLLLLQETERERPDVDVLRSCAFFAGHASLHSRELLEDLRPSIPLWVKVMANGVAAIIANPSVDRGVISLTCNTAVALGNLAVSGRELVDDLVSAGAVEVLLSAVTSTVRSIAEGKTGVSLDPARAALQAVTSLFRHKACAKAVEANAGKAEWADVVATLGDPQVGPLIDETLCERFEAAKQTLAAFGPS
jgi:serine/threonine protein kinase